MQMMHWHTRVISSNGVDPSENARLTNSIPIVEDEESVRISLAMVLSRLGLRVRSASDGPAALMEMRNEAPDVII